MEKMAGATSDEYGYLLSLAFLFKGDFSIDWLVELTGKKPTQILLFMEKGIEEGCLTRIKPGVYSFSSLKEQKKWGENLSSGELELHRKIASLLMRDLPENEEKVQMIAHHLLSISNDLETCRWLMKAGNAHLKAFHIEEALLCFNKILDDLSGRYGEETDQLYIDAALKYSKVSPARQDTTKVLSVLHEATLRAKVANNQTSLALLEMNLAKNEWFRSQYEIALRHFEDGWSFVKRINDPKLIRSATTFSTFFLNWQGRFKEAVEVYEKSVPDVEKFPQGGFPLLATLTMGRCYAQMGQVTQGLGMLDAIRTHCLEQGNKYMAAYAGHCLGVIMLDIRHMDEAFQYLERSEEEATQEHNDWVQIMAKLDLAFAYYIKEDFNRSSNYLKKFLQHSTAVEMTFQPYPYLMEICWAMEKGKFPPVPEISLEKEISRLLESKNIFMKGVAYRYWALLQKERGLPHKRIIQSLNTSLKWLKESGHQIEIARTQLELARELLCVGDEEKAKEMARHASEILTQFNENMIPDDFRSYLKEPPRGEDLFKEILTVSQELVAIRDNKALIQHIISAVNRMTGAERGAIFLFDRNSNPPRLRLRASKNLTSVQITQPSFASSMKMIDEVFSSGRGRIQESNRSANGDRALNDIIRSRVCVPMILRGKVEGVLYHDNRLLSSAFNGSDLELLGYFAALAAFALDNAKAYEEIQQVNQQLREEKRYYEEQHFRNLLTEDIIGDSPSFRRVLDQVYQVANTGTNVLILGETGVGKELVARAIHRNSPRSDKPFIRVLCSALPDTLIPSELFGHERGAFTGATQRRIGRFELANGGTIFLDEIGDLPWDVQVRLLRILQDKEFERVGGNETIHSDFRLLTATNRNLEQEVKANRFRPDLYYRLNVFPILVPPLRERKNDIPLLAQHFLKVYAAKMGKIFERIPAEEMNKLLHYDWPGNVRELENIIERSTILSSPPNFRAPELESNYKKLDLPINHLTMSEMERHHIVSILHRTGWKVTGPAGAADILGINPSTLSFRMKKLGIERPRGFPKRRNGLHSLQ